MPEDKRAEEIIRLYDAEETKAANSRSLFQDVAEYVVPRQDQITQISSPGSPKTDHLLDSTAVLAAQEMRSGLSNHLVPPGQKFFGFRATKREIGESEDVKRWLSSAADVEHEQLFASNFSEQLDLTLLADSVFGTGCLFSEYKTSLNFRDYDIGSYLPMENSKRVVDAILVKFVFTARQAFDKWGEKAGEKVGKAMEKVETQGNNFEFVHLVRPRESRNPRLSDNLNAPFESFYVAVKDKVIVEEGGFFEFPYHVGRWTRVANEVFGRGRGTFSLPDVKMLQTMRKGYITCANLQNNPPLKVRMSFEGRPNVFPGALIRVMDMDDIQALHPNALGNFGITEKAVEAQQELVRKVFYNDIFVQLANLTGDRRTTLEIRERIAEGLKRLGPPIGRFETEILSPLVIRTLFMLVRNEVIAPPPKELIGQNFEVDYIGPLALQLKSHQIGAFRQWIMDTTAIAEVKPDALDNIDIDFGVREMGEGYGVNIDAIASLEEVQRIREERAKQEQAQQALQMAQMAAQGYKDTSKAAEAGSPAKELQEAVS